MAEDTKNVGIKSDTGTKSIGLSTYFENDKNNDKKHFKIMAYITVALIVSIFLTGLFGKRKIVGQNSKELQPPSFNREVPLTAPRILNQSDQMNMNQKKYAAADKKQIQILTLRGMTEIPVGSEVKAVLVSGGTDGIVKAKLTQSLIVDGEPLIPENSIIFGKGKSGEERLYVEFNKVILPTGESFKFTAQSFDLSDKIQGLKGAVVGTRAKKMGMAVGLGFIGGMADGMRETSGSIFMSQKPTMKDAALSGASKAALVQSEAYLEEMKKSPNIIEVKAGTEFMIIVDEAKKKEAYEK